MNQHKETIRVSYSFDDNETLVVTKDIKNQIEIRRDYYLGKA